MTLGGAAIQPESTLRTRLRTPVDVHGPVFGKPSVYMRVDYRARFGVQGHVSHAIRAMKAPGGAGGGDTAIGQYSDLAWSVKNVFLKTALHRRIRRKGV